jgi:aminoglycoside phosphotransferase
MQVNMDYSIYGALFFQGRNADYYRDGDVLHVIFKQAESVEQIEAIAEKWRIAAAAGINAPKIISVEANAVGQPVMTREFIHGHNFLEIIASMPEEYDEMLELLVDKQAEIHAADIADIGGLRDVLPLQADILRDGIQNLSAISEENRARLLDKLNRAMTGEVHFCLCHGDFCPSSAVLCAEEDDEDYDEAEELCIVDWKRACVGLAAADVAAAYLKINCVSTELAESYLRMYCEKTGMNKAEVRDLLAVAAAKQLQEGPISLIHQNLLEAWLES